VRLEVPNGGPCCDSQPGDDDDDDAPPFPAECGADCIEQTVCVKAAALGAVVPPAPCDGKVGDACSFDRISLSIVLTDICVPWICLAKVRESGV